MASENLRFIAQTFRTSFWFPASSTAVPTTGIERNRTDLTLPKVLKSLDTDWVVAVVGDGKWWVVVGGGG